MLRIIYKYKSEFFILVFLFSAVSNLFSLPEKQIFPDKSFFIYERDLSSFRILPENQNADAPVTWNYLKPVALDYDNTQKCASGRFCVEKIQYQKVDISYFAEDHSLPLKSLAFMKSSGTYFVQAESKKSKVIFRIAVRNDDSYTGYLSELTGVPFVYWPRFIQGHGHQTDLGLGADCIAVLIYGRRRMGYNIPYFAPGKLYSFSEKIGDSISIQNAKIRDGDILHFSFQTAVIYKDLPPIGRLSGNDIIFHTYHKTAEKLEFSELPYRKMPFDILRWK
ncbi:MAG: hypothetical protein OEZ34_11265 [Spirochaetia bacterium]|nr:hypothetical protein [Spirochaetia bacterium]